MITLPHVHFCDLFAVKMVLLPHADFFRHPGVCVVASLGNFKAVGSTMAEALKLETLTRLCMWYICIFRWLHKCGEGMAATKTYQLCRKNCWEKEAEVPIQAAADRRRVSARVDFVGRFSHEKKFKDRNFGGRNPKSSPTRCAHQSKTHVCIPTPRGIHAHSVCSCIS